MIATSIEQSKKLLELGVNPETADMCHHCIYMGDDEHPYYKLGIREPICKTKDCIPAWSLTALLKLMPDYTLQTTSDGLVFCVCDNTPTNLYDNPIDAVVVLIEWLIEDGYIKTQKEG